MDGDIHDDERYAAMAALNPASSTATATTQIIEDQRRALERLAERARVRRSTRTAAIRCSPTSPG